VPDFALTGQVIKAMFEDQFSNGGINIDAVFSIDPLVLRELMTEDDQIAVSLPNVPEGEDTSEASKILLNKDNLAKVLMHDIYTQIDGNQNQDKFFAQTSKVVFNKYIQNPSTRNSGGKKWGENLAQTVLHSATGGRLKAWSDMEDFQQIFHELGISGAIINEANESEQKFYFFQNDVSTSKLDWYIRKKVDIASTGCLAGGSQDFDVTLEVTNTITPAEANQLPPYITGENATALEVAPGTLVTNLQMIAPLSAEILSFSTNSTITWNILDQTYQGRASRMTTVSIPPGQTVTLKARVRASHLISDHPSFTEHGNGLQAFLTPGAHLKDTIEIDRTPCFK
jgi:hypothetical protein